jgi:hypothetical protein
MMSFLKDYVALRRSQGNLLENEDCSDDGDDDNDDGDDNNEEEEEPDAACDDMIANDSLASFPSGSPPHNSHSAQSSHASTSAHNLNTSTCPQFSEPSSPGSYSSESQIKNKSTRRPHKQRLDANNKLLELEEERLELLRKDMNSNTHERSDKQFLKSLLPFMESFSETENLEVRRQLRQVVINKPRAKKQIRVTP